MGLASWIGRAAAKAVYGIPQGFREARAALAEARDEADGVVPGSTEEERRAQRLLARAERLERDSAKQEAETRRKRADKLAKLETEIAVLSAMSKARRTAATANLPSPPEVTGE